MVVTAPKAVILRQICHHFSKVDRDFDVIYLNRLGNVQILITLIMFLPH